MALFMNCNMGEGFGKCNLDGRLLAESVSSAERA